LLLWVLEGGILLIVFNIFPHLAAHGGRGHATQPVYTFTRYPAPLALVALLWLLLSTSAQAGTCALATRIVVTVSTPVDAYDLSANGACSLHEAIRTLHCGPDFGGCTRVVVAGNGPPTIIVTSETCTSHHHRRES